MMVNDFWGFSIDWLENLVLISDGVFFFVVDQLCGYFSYLAEFGLYEVAVMMGCLGF